MKLKIWAVAYSEGGIIRDVKLFPTERQAEEFHNEVENDSNFDPEADDVATFEIEQEI